MICSSGQRIYGIMEMELTSHDGDLHVVVVSDNDTLLIDGNDVMRNLRGTYNEPMTSICVHCKNKQLTIKLNIYVVKYSHYKI